MGRILVLLLFTAWGATLAAQQMPAWLNRPIQVKADTLLLEDALYELMERYDLPLSFRNDQLPVRQVRLPQGHIRTYQLLEVILLHTGLDYEIVGNQLLIVPRREIPRYTISGYIEDKSSGERLIGANVYDRVSGQGAASNEYGFFSLTLPAGPVELQLSYLGYAGQQEIIELQENRNLRIRLSPHLTLQEIVVTAADSVAPSSAFQEGGTAIGLVETRLLPSLGGEPDPLRIAQLLPGVTGGADGLEGIHLRGSESGHNLVLLDGVPVYNLNHGAGLLSLFNSSALRSVELYKDAIPAQYGGRLAGVLDVRTKEGNLYRHTASGSISLLAGQVLVEGPLAEGRSSFLLTGRWSYVHPVLNGLSRDYKSSKGLKGVTDYRFHDLNLKVNHIFSRTNRLYFSLYRGSDGFANRSSRTDVLQLQDDNGVVYRWQVDQSYREQLSWGNTVGALRWNHLFSNKLFGNATLTFSSLNTSGYYFRNDSLVELSSNLTLHAYSLGRLRSGIRDWGGRIDMQYLPQPGVEWRFGGAYTLHRFNPGVLSLDETIDIADDEELVGNESANSRDLNLYVQVYRRLDHWWYRLGAHLSRWQVRKANYWHLQPRLAAGARMGERWRWNLSYDRTVQPIHLLTTATIGLPTDIWTPATAEAPPAAADQISTGIEFQPGPDWQLQLDLFAKSMYRLRNFSEGAAFLSNWEENTTDGRGTARGLEVMLQRRRGRLRGWLSYTLARSDRQFDRINLGRTYPFKYDRRHDLKAALIFKLNDHLHLSANWIYSTGAAYSLSLEKFRLALPDQQYNGGVEVLVFGSKNQFRLPDYHRFDLAANWEWGKDRPVGHGLTVGVYNLYSRRNPIYYDLRTTYVNQDDRLFAERDFVQIFLAPVLPSLSYRFIFR